MFSVFSEAPKGTSPVSQLDKYSVCETGRGNSDGGTISAQDCGIWLLHSSYGLHGRRCRGLLEKGYETRNLSAVVGDGGYGLG